MTSSLVGSEMCIRDSFKGYWLFVPVGQVVTTSALHRPPKAKGDAPQPVSYTHLTLPTICSV
eukprot:7366501-Prorocentrum_lima.AAC.1